MSLTIRPAVPQDAALILTLVGELAAYERLAHEVDADAALIEAALSAQPQRVFCDIAERSGAAAGFALWFYNFSTFRGRHGLYLEDLFVRPAHRGRGIGKALLARLARRCREEGLARFEWSVLDWNAPSIAFYVSLGAVPLADWTTFRLSGDALDKLAELGQ